MSLDSNLFGFFKRRRELVTLGQLEWLRDGSLPCCGGTPILPRKLKKVRRDTVWYILCAFPPPPFLTIGR